MFNHPHHNSPHRFHLLFHPSPPPLPRPPLSPPSLLSSPMYRQSPRR
ncbi:hypothetical protein CsSME_00026495 [Camellia sinensis var. sinensis]